MHAVLAALTEHLTFKVLQYFPVRLAPLTFAQTKSPSSTAPQVLASESHAHYFLSPSSPPKHAFSFP